MSLESSSAARRYFPHVNLLRGFAALSVVIYHIIEHYEWKSFPTEYGLVWFRMGWMAVDLFFVISGFVIAWSLIQLHQRKLPFRSLSREFLWRRAGRIMPLYWLTILAYVVLIGTHFLQLWTWPHWLTHALFLHPFHPQFFGSMNGVNWSVGVEVHFYVFALLTSPWWVRRKPLTVCLSGIGLAWGLRALAWFVAAEAGYSGTQLFGIMVQMPLMLDEFAIGAALALLVHHHPPEKWAERLTAIKYLLPALPVLLIGLALFFYWQDRGYWHNPYLVIFWRSSIALGFASLLALCIWLPPLNSPGYLYRAAYYLGDISYGIYLWHITVIELLKPFIKGQPELYLIAVLPPVLLLSAASWHWLEKPCIRWSKTRSKAVV